MACGGVPQLLWAGIMGENRAPIAAAASVFTPGGPATIWRVICGAARGAVPTKSPKWPAPYRTDSLNIIRPSSRMSETNIWPGEWVMAKGILALSSTAWGVTPQAQNTGISPSLKGSGSP